MSYKDDELAEAGLHDEDAVIEGEGDVHPKKIVDPEEAEELSAIAAVPGNEDETDPLIDPLEDDDEDSLPPPDMGEDERYNKLD